MSACTYEFNGIADQCKDAIGGIRKAWVANKDDVTVTITAGEVSAITGTFVEYNFRKQTGSMTSTATVDDAAGTIFYTTEANLQFSKLDTAKRTEMVGLVKADSVVILEDNNRNKIFLGYDYPVSVTALTGESGTALGDSNGYKVTLQDISYELPYFLAEGVEPTV